MKLLATLFLLLNTLKIWAGECETSSVPQSPSSYMMIFDSLDSSMMAASSQPSWFPGLLPPFVKKILMTRTSPESNQESGSTPCTLSPPGIIADPEISITLPVPKTTNDIRKLIINPQNAPFKYLILDRAGSGGDGDNNTQKTTIHRSPRTDNHWFEGAIGRFIFFQPPYVPLLIEDNFTSPYAPLIRPIENKEISQPLLRLFSPDTHYVVIFINDYDQLAVLIKNKDGTVKIMSHSEWLFFYGEWFDRYIYQHLLAHFEESYGAYLSVTPYGPSAAEIPNLPPKKLLSKNLPPKKKGDSNKGEEVVDGQASSKGMNEQSQPPPVPFPATTEPVEKAKGKPEDPDPTGATNEGIPADTPANFEAYANKKAEQDRVAYRHTVAKAVTSMAQASNLRGKAIEQLARKIPKGKLANHFKHFITLGFPLHRRQKQIEWLLDHGHIYPLSRFALEHASSSWQQNANTTNTLVKRYSTRSRNTKQTDVRSNEAPNQSQPLVDILTNLSHIMQKDKTLSTGIATVKTQAMARLEGILDENWQFIVRDRRTTPSFHSAEHLELMSNSGTTSTVTNLAETALDALNYLLWDEEEAAKLIDMVAQMIPPNLDANIREQLESHVNHIGELETHLGLSSLIRLNNHLHAPGSKGALRLNPVRKHITISFFESFDLKPSYVLVTIDLEYTGFKITTPVGQSLPFESVIAIRDKSRYDFGSRTLMHTQQDLIVRPPSEFLLPTPSQISQWKTELIANNQKIISDDLIRRQGPLVKAQKILKDAPPETLEDLSQLARFIKKSNQLISPNWQRAREWEHPIDNIEALATELMQVVREYSAAVERILPNISEDSSHPEGNALVQEYITLVQDIRKIQERMSEIDSTTETVDSATHAAILALVEQNTNIGNRMRTSDFPLPKRKKELEENGQLSQQQNMNIIYLLTSYYPYSSAIGMHSARMSYRTPLKAIENESRRSRLISEGSEQTEPSAEPADPKPSVEPDPKPSLPIVINSDDNDYDNDDLLDEEEADPQSPDNEEFPGDD